MEKLNKICHNIRIAFRKRDTEALNIYSKMLWSHMSNNGWKLCDNYKACEDKFLLDRGIACTIQGFIFKESAINGLRMKLSFMLKAISELSLGIQVYANNKSMKAECAYWMSFCIYSNISLLQNIMKNTLIKCGKTINEENMTIIVFLILGYLQQFCIEKDNIEMTYTPLFDGRNGLNESKYFQLLSQYQDKAIPLLQNATNNPNVEFDMKSLPQESLRAYERFLLCIKLEESSPFYKSVMKC